MTYDIVWYPDPILRAKGKPVGEVTPEIRQLVEDMLETMRDQRGVGLAAQQIGKDLQLAVVDITGCDHRESRMWIDGQAVNPEDHMPLVLIDPKLKLTKNKVRDVEGCLSFPGLHHDINRAVRVKCQTRTLDGAPFVFEAAGLLGRAVQHETDHLHGRLFIDLLSDEERKKIREQIERIKQGLPATDESDDQDL